jgi:glycogen debranching enzyme
VALGPILNRAPGVLQARPGLRYTYRGLSVLVSGRDGTVRGHGSQGFHHRNTRFLSRLDLTVDGHALTPFSAGPVSSDRLLAYAAVDPGRALHVPDGWPDPAVYAEMRFDVSDGLRVQVDLHAHHPRRRTSFVMGLEVDADFADSEEAEAGQERQRGDAQPTWRAETRELVFRSADAELGLGTSVRVIEAPGEVRCESGTILVPVDLGPQGAARVVLVVEPLLEEGAGHEATITAHRPARAAARASAELAEAAPRLVSTNATVARAWDTAMRDLVSLPLGIDDGPATAIAGLPLYQQFFGRDSLTVAWQALMALPALARDALTANAAYQGRVIDDWRDEEPGKMIHQARWGPRSLRGEDPYLRYYGDYATVPDFLIVLGQYLAWTGDLAFARGLLPAARSGLDWLARYADIDGDGWIEYVTRSEMGLKNQGWLDSGDAIVDDEGRIVRDPIATSELQGYAYAALGQAAFVAFTLGDVGLALDLMARARRMRAAFAKAFWAEDLGTFVQALGPDKRPVRTLASNAGHVLATGIALPPQAGRVAARLLRHDMFTGWGVRTLSSAHPAFDPFSYHRGSVWPVEQGTIAFGLARYARWDELHRLARGFFDLTDLFVANRLPEVVGGVQRDGEHGHPGTYPGSHEPQAWSASSVILMVQALLGLRALAPLRILLVDPHLPDWLPDLELSGLRVGAARVDLAFRRDRRGRTALKVVRRSGRVLVRRQSVHPRLTSVTPFLG